MKLRQAKNRCNDDKCRHEWVDWPGSYAVHYDGCPRCGSLYWTWLNADEWKK